MRYSPGAVAESHEHVCATTFFPSYFIFFFLLNDHLLSIQNMNLVCGEVKSMVAEGAAETTQSTSFLSLVCFVINARLPAVLDSGR